MSTTLLLRTTFWDDPFLFKICADQMIRWCVHGKEALDILEACHNGPTGGHHGATSPPKRSLMSDSFLAAIYKDAHSWLKIWTVANDQEKFHKRDEMPQNFPIQVCEIFDVWASEYMGPFPSSRAQNKYILVASIICQNGLKQSLPIQRRPSCKVMAFNMESLIVSPPRSHPQTKRASLKYQIDVYKEFLKGQTNTPGHRGRRLSLFGKLVILSSYCSKKRFNNGLQVWKIKGKDPPNSILNFFEFCENPVESLNMIRVELGDDLFIVF
ncbi:hypothetical protein Tco_0940391 [Tanacetum coccineum]|uniref:Reverse transcriptase domain-containing protein n=1 Tax=Tanacetum coccineum TaxID=301880 RepID=A0ABQ5DMW3_9ASTR